MQNLRVSLVQTDPIWQQPELNMKNIADQCRLYCLNTDLIILPEMFSAGFGTDPKVFAELPDGNTFQWMTSLAKELNTAICGSYAVLLEDKAVNRLLWTYPDGSSTHYDKRHLFRMMNEHMRYHAGNERVTVDYLGWRINLQVCYDLRFPVWCRNTGDFDLQLYVANWPAARRHPWRTLLQARAMENLAYVIGVNRTGLDGKNLAYSGDSMVVSPAGDILVDCKSIAGIYHHSLSMQVLLSFRERFPAYLDADEFSIKN